MTKFMTCSILVALCSPAMAQDTFEPSNYTSLGLSTLRNDSIATPDDIEMTGVVLGLGRHINSWYSLEARLGSTFSGGRIRSAYNRSGEVVTRPNLKMKLDHIGGIYNRFNISSGGRVSPYVLAGYSVAKATLSTPRGLASSTSKDFTFGVGVDACGSTRCMRIELTRYFESDKSTLDALTASVLFHI